MSTSFVNHLNEKGLNRRSLFPMYEGQNIDVIGSNYLIMRDAINSGADLLKITTRGFTWSLKGKRLGVERFGATIFGLPYHKLQYDKLIRVHRSALEKIIELDEVVRNYTRIISNTCDELTIQFLEIENTE